MAAQSIVADGHAVVLHARNASRGREAMAAVPGATAVLVGDLASIAQTRRLAEAANAFGPFDAVIHNATIGFRERRRVLTEDGLPHVFAINTLAPYILTALIHPPGRLVYVSSELHRHGHAGLDDLVGVPGVAGQPGLLRHQAARRAARLRRRAPLAQRPLQRAGAGLGADQDGGARATGDLDAAHRTQGWLAVSDAARAAVTDGCFFHKQPRKPSGATLDTGLQDGLLAECAQLSGVPFPKGPG